MYCFYWVDVTMYITRNAHLLLRSVFERVSLLFFSMYSMQSTHQQKERKKKRRVHGGQALQGCHFPPEGGKRSMRGHQLVGALKTFQLRLFEVGEVVGLRARFCVLLGP